MTPGFREQEESNLFRQILDISDKRKIPYLRTLALYASALDLVHAGELKKARALTTQSIEFGRDSNYPPAVSWGHSTRAIVGVASRDSEKACIDAREAIRHASCQYDRIMAESIHALALALSGELDEGLAVIERVRPDVAGRGVNNLLPTLDMAHGILLVQTEGLDRGLSCFADLHSRLEEQDNRRALCALEFVIGERLLAMSSNDHSCVDTLYWARARLSGREGADPGDARVHLERAIRLAEEANMQFFLEKARERLSSLGNLQGRNVDNANSHRRRTT